MLVSVPTDVWKVGNSTSWNRAESTRLLANWCSSDVSRRLTEPKPSLQRIEAKLKSPQMRTEETVLLSLSFDAYAMLLLISLASSCVR